MYELVLYLLHRLAKIGTGCKPELLVCPKQRPLLPIFFLPQIVLLLFQFFFRSLLQETAKMVYDNYKPDFLVDLNGIYFQAPEPITAMLE